MDFFKNSRIDVYNKMWEFMNSRPYVMVNSTREGVEFVRESEGRYAFLLEAAMNDYNNERFPCDTIRVGKNLDYKGYGIATSKGSGLHASVNKALLNLQSKRMPEALQRKWWRSECPPGDSYTREELSLANVVGVFFLLAAFLVIAMFIAIIEFCVKSNSEAKRAKTSLSDAMKNKARLALATGREVDSVRFYGDSSAL
jgi:ionotropic glutamate receptor